MTKSKSASSEAKGDFIGPVAVKLRDICKKKKRHSIEDWREGRGGENAISKSLSLVVQSLNKNRCFRRYARRAGYKFVLRTDVRTCRADFFLGFFVCFY